MWFKWKKNDKPNQQQLEQESLEQEKLEQERLEQERLEQERLEQERLEQERLEQERLEQERLEQERLEQERLEQERLEQERLEQEKLEKTKETQPAAKPKNRLWAGLKKTRQAFSGLFSSHKIDETWLDDLEDQMIMADVGTTSTSDFIENLRRQVKQDKAKTAQDVLNSLHGVMLDKLALVENKPINDSQELFVLVMVGINGVGKTTTTAKIAKLYQQQGKKVMLAACDTFRAAAIEQLQTWGDRLNVPVISHKHGADAAAVAHDAYQSAKAKGIDVLIVDTAGRQHTHKDLMDQLGKIKRVLTKLDDKLPHETWIVLDAGNGQNVLSQIEKFSQYTPISGVCLTKLDGTAKGGIAFAIAEKFNLPVRYIGVGEQMEDLLPFNARDFVKALVDVDAK